MFQLFELRQVPNTITKRGQDWHNVYTGLKANLDTVLQYYRNHSLAVPAEHFLVTLINSLGVSTNLNLERYYNNVCERALDLSRVMNLTSPISRGKPLKGVFFSEDCIEAVLSLDDDFDYEHVHENWREVSAVRVLRHPVSDLSLLPWSKRTQYTDVGVAISSVNIPMLAVQYRAFRLHERELAKQDPEYVERTVMHFVQMYALTNMLPSYLDCVLFNRMYNLTVGKPMGSALKRQPFHLVDWRSRLTKTQTDILERLGKSKVDMHTLLANCPLVDEFSGLEFSVLPDVAKTRQVMWLLIMSRLRILIWLLSMSERNGNIQDEGFVNRLRHFFRRVKLNNQIVTQLPLAFKEEMEEDLEELYRLLGI